jgi:hypothetical protein
MLEIPSGSKWRDQSVPTGPVIITVESVDVGSNTVVGTSVPEKLPTVTAVWVGAPSDFECYERIA